MGIQLALPQKGVQPPNFWPVSIVAKWSPISAAAEHLLVFILCYFCDFGISCLGILGLFIYVVSTSAIEFPKRPPQNDRLCVERDVKHLFTHSLLFLVKDACLFSSCRFSFSLVMR